MVRTTSRLTGMSIQTFQGKLLHRNPICTRCDNHCYALYQGGRKERVDDTFVCKKCSIIFKIPKPPKCEFTEMVK